MSKESPLKRWLNRKNKAGQLASTTSSAPARSAGSVAMSAPDQTESLRKWHPLSAGQQRLWLLQELNPENPFYHYAETYRLQGDLDVKKLQQAYREVVMRHDILRTTFKNVEGIPRQMVHTEPTFQFLFEDLSGLNSESKEAASKQRCLDVANAPFNLEKGPLSRLLLQQLGKNDYLLLIAMHHIITDKWSMRVLRKELSKRYKGLSLLSPEVQYATYFANLDKKANPKNSLTYWKEKLSDLPALLKLPYDRLRPDTPSYRGGYRKAALSPALTSSLKKAARSNDVTLFVYLLSAYKVLLNRYSGENNFAVGTPVSNRNNQRLEETIGFFNETIALKAELKENLTFPALVQNTRRSVMEAFAHMDVSFEDIVQEVNPERQLGVNPLFQTMFILHIEPEAASFGPDLRLSPVPLDTGVTKFDLTVYVADEGEQLSVTIEFSADLFEASTIDRMQGHFLQILEEVSSQTEIAVQDINMLPAVEQQTLLSEWNNTEFPLPDESRIHDLIGQVALANPELIAATYAGKQLTYGELEEQGEALARRLCQLGVAPNTVVGLYTDPGLEMVIGIVAILKAGGAYLPLDPEYPQDRIDYLIEDAGANLMLTTTTLVDKLPIHYRDRLLLLDKAKQEGETAGAEKVKEAGMEDMAYMIYTSGSTGQPKGVMVSHTNLLHSTLARQQYYPTKPTAFLLLSSFSFDSSVAGIFWALTTGAKLVLAPRRIEQDLEALADLIASEDVSHTLMLPTLYDTILRFIEGDKLASLQTVIVAGEACTSALTRLHHSTLPSVSLYNEYGPTEASVWCTAYEVKAPIEEGPVPIGQAIPNAKAYVLNGRKKTLCPIGVAGELFIGGKGVTKGYWQRPDLTGASFFPNPFIKGERIYRTGDRARWLPDGNLQFLGRADRQIKLRGYRIELGEIREALLAHSGITGAIVKADKAQQRLLAYFTSSTSVSIDAIRKDLKARLPKHMVPAFLTEIKAFPQLANGKIDEASLPAPSRSEAQAARSPSKRTLSPEEATLLNIWQEALGEKNIEINDNFFEVGGDSILSIQIVARARRAGLRLSPRAIFEHQTVAELALFIHAGEAPEVTIAATGDFPLLPIQQWFFAEHQAAPHHWNQAAALEIAATIEVLIINKAITSLLKIHSGLRQRFHQTEQGHWQVSLSEEILPHETILVSIDELGGTTSISSIEQYLADQQPAYKLTEAPLLHSYFFPAVGDERARLVLVAHHLIIDVVSWRILVEDLQQFLTHPATVPELAPATAPYSVWSRKLKKMTQDGHFTNDLAFWQAQQHVDLPNATDVVLPVTEAETEQLSISLSPEETAPLLNEVHRAFNTTTQDLLLAALLTTIGAEQLHLSLEHNGREAVGGSTDFTRSIGWFTASYPITLTRGNEIAETIINVKEKLRQVPANGLSYGALRYFGEQDLQQQPTTLFNYLGRINTQASGGENHWQLLEQGLRAQQSERYRVWEINVAIFDDSLRITWHFANTNYSQDTMAGLLNKYIDTIRSIIDYCLDQEQETFTPSDFPEADLSQEDLDNLLDQIDL